MYFVAPWNKFRCFPLDAKIKFDSQLYNFMSPAGETTLNFIVELMSLFTEASNEETHIEE